MFQDLNAKSDEAASEVGSVLSGKWIKLAGPTKEEIDAKLRSRPKELLLSYPGQTTSNLQRAAEDTGFDSGYLKL